MPGSSNDSLRDIVVRIDERTEAIDERITSTGNHLAKLIDQEREDRKEDIKQVRGELKRLPAIISGAVGTAIAGIAAAFGFEK